MTTKSYNHTLAARDGQTQQQRLPAVPPASVALDGRSTKELLAYIHAIAKEIKFFDHQLPGLNTSGNTWQEILGYNEDNFEELYTRLEELKQQKAVPAHFALLLTFLELYKEPQRLMNEVTGRHLDFYYHEVLGLKKNEPVPDRAHIVFELKKNTAPYLLQTNTPLLAGKDSTKKDLVYKLTHDIIVNNSKIEQLKSLFVNPANMNMVHVAAASNSADGMGAELDPVNPKWNAFGHKDLPLAQIGFCFGADVLLMQEGNRKVTVKMAMTGLSSRIKDDMTIAHLFSVSATGEKGWTNPRSVSPKVIRANDRLVALEFSFSFDADDPAIVGYDSELHGDEYETDKPLMRVMINSRSLLGYAHFKNASLTQATISVAVSGMSSLQLENDFGLLDPKKPFHPFGTSPENDANFWIGSPEVFNKQLSSLTLNVEWKNIPAKDLREHFKEYSTVVKNSSFTANVSFTDGAGWKVVNSRQELFNEKDAKYKDQDNVSVKWEFGGSISARPAKPPARNIPDNYLPAQLSRTSGISLVKELSNKIEARSVATTSKKIIREKKIIQKKGIRRLAEDYFPSHKANATVRDNYIHLALNQGFMFRQYRRLFTEQVLQVSKEKREPDDLIKEPFAPEMQSLKLDYQATTGKVSFTDSSLNDYAGSEIEFFHAGPFGQMREHSYARTQNTFLTNTSVRLLPEYSQEGNFYIGISGVQANDSLSLLLQLAAGSADPALPKANPTWSVLCDNYWKELSSTDFIFDTTNELLKSGVVRIVIPREATTDNSIMPAGLIWIKVSLAAHARAVCQFTAVQANAAIAEFFNNDNDPLHLQSALPGNTINKLQTAVGAIKQVSQPYASFGGRMQEDDNGFQSRVSERLRHKQRAITCWDYERLILQQFPGIYKVKCINHSSARSFLDAGSALVILVPDLTNQNAVNPFQPRVDKNTMDEVLEFLQQQSSAWADYDVRNPFYEPVKISVSVKLKNGYEFNYYQQEINKVLQNYLSPWVNAGAGGLRFGGRVTASQIVKLLEELEYVDFLADLQLFHSVDAGRNFTLCKQFVETTGPASILVSHLQHDVKQS